MITVINAGGSGSRLWPLSTPDYPKHLLKINGQQRSLLQNTYDRVKDISSAVYVITEQSHAHHIKEQLSDLPEEAFIIEPARRGTANCILAGLIKIGHKHDKNESISFIASDHYIRDVKGYANTFKRGAEIAESEGRIVLVGIEPDRPEIGFGYIQKGKMYDQDGLVYEVHSFKEKPEYKVAQQYFKSGNYLWNSGSFIGSVSVFIDTMKQFAPNLYKSYQALSDTKTEAEFLEKYLSLDNIAVEYVLIEQVKNLLVIPATYDWMDMGSFTDLHKAVDSNEQGNHTHGFNVELDGVTNSFVQNYEDKPVAVIGLDGIVVVNTPSGILVAKKDLSQNVGDVSKRFKKEK